MRVYGIGGLPRRAHHPPLVLDVEVGTPILAVVLKRSMPTVVSAAPEPRFGEGQPGVGPGLAAFHAEIEVLPV
jgi:hypothetical protein